MTYLKAVTKVVLILSVIGTPAIVGYGLGVDSVDIQEQCMSSLKAKQVEETTAIIICMSLFAEQ